MGVPKARRGKVVKTVVKEEAGEEGGVKEEMKMEASASPMVRKRRKVKVEVKEEEDDDAMIADIEDAIPNTQSLRLTPGQEHS